MSKTALFVQLRAKPGKRDEVRGIWERHLMPNIAANPTHTAYFYCYDANDPDVVRVYQQYADHAAAAEFVKAPWYAAYIKEVTPLLVGDAEVHVVTPTWAKTWSERAAA